MATGALGAGVVVEPVDVCEPPLLGAGVDGVEGAGVGAGVEAGGVVWRGVATGGVAFGAGADEVFDGTWTFGMLLVPVDVEVDPGSGVVVVEAGGVVAAGGTVVPAGGACATCAAALCDGGMVWSSRSAA
jgi:hypothetical protein